MRGAELGLGTLVGLFVVGMTAAQASDLPPGPNRDLVAHECTACHEIDRVADSNETKETWNILLDSMTSYGLRVTPEERAKILEYLVTALGPK